ncbi:chaperonin 10-like protein [Phascolomyces articulosus]|uniref:Chaperonin 10-like protein n=1 Tax=Phascolomyces articulosus TaxID=60185 RepID=A0AAD5KD35_9FUNG|nr:chaperonin 10-like protein [Phascolomyces articulosus]
MSSSIPEIMNALQLIKQRCPPEEAFEYRQVKVPIMKKPTDILVNVKAAAINPAESKFRSGNVMTISVPRTMGCDYSGVIVAKGSQVTEFNIGDAVFGVLDNHTKGPEGSYAEYIVASIESGSIAKKPDNVSFEEAASIGVTALTAMQGIGFHGNMLSEDKNTRPKKVVVVGASGGVGAHSVQFAKALGAQEVTAICSSKNTFFVQSLGADRVVDYTSPESMEQFLSSQKEQLDLVMDCVGGEAYYTQLRPLLKPKTGIYCTAAGPIIHPATEPLGISDWAYLVSTVLYRRFFGPCPYFFIRDIPWQTMKTTIQPWLVEGTVRGVVGKDQVFDLKDGAKAHVLLDTLHASGRIILKVS